MEPYDIAVLGAGPGGYVAAIRAAQYGARVALIEKDELGGVCLNQGCIPSKALLESVHALKILQSAGEFGLSCENVGFDLKQIYARKDKIVSNLRDGVATLLKKNKVKVIKGHGRLKSATVIAVEGREIAAGKLILATGTVPLRPRSFPMDADNIVTSDYFLALRELPRSVLVIGGGYIGCELATVLQGLGAEVTVVEMLPRLVPLADEDIAKELRREFKRAKIAVHLNTKVDKLEVTGAGEVTATLSSGKTVVTAKALVAIGREMRTQDIGLERAGLTANHNGTLSVNQYCQTSVPDIYAIGDIAGRQQLAHVASKMGLVAAAHATGRKAAVNYNVIPSAVFTQPEIGSVGLTEAEAKETGCAVKCARFDLRGLGKAWAMGAARGFFKLVANAKTGEVLGVHIIGPHAADLIAEAALALQIECTVEEIAATIHAHPTLAEGLMECAEVWLGRGIHG